MSFVFLYNILCFLYLYLWMYSFAQILKILSHYFSTKFCLLFSLFFADSKTMSIRLYEVDTQTTDALFIFLTVCMSHFDSLYPCDFKFTIFPAIPDLLLPSNIFFISHCALLYPEVQFFSYIT